MNIIQLYPFQLIIRKKEAFWLPNGNFGYPGVIIFWKQNKVEVVPYKGCISSNYLERDVYFDIENRIIEVEKILRDRGIQKINFCFNIFDSSFDSTLKPMLARFKENIWCPTEGEDWFKIKAHTDKLISSANPKKTEILSWLLSQPENLFITESVLQHLGGSLNFNRGINTEKIEDFVKKLVPTWDPAKLIVELTRFPVDEPLRNFKFTEKINDILLSLAYKEED